MCVCVLYDVHTCVVCLYFRRRTFSKIMHIKIFGCFIRSRFCPMYKYAYGQTCV